MFFSLTECRRFASEAVLNLDAFNAGRRAGEEAHKGKADKLRDGQAAKLNPHPTGSLIAQRWQAGFIAGWATYKPIKARKRA